MSEKPLLCLLQALAIFNKAVSDVVIVIVCETNISVLICNGRYTKVNNSKMVGHRKLFEAIKGFCYVKHIKNVHF